MVEPGESPDEAAIRETKEETGLDAAIERKIAEYLRPQMPGGEDRLHIFLAKPTAGVLDPRNRETAALRWATIDRIPTPANPYLRSYFQDYRSNRPGVIQRTITLPRRWGLGMQVLYAVRTVCIGIRNQPE
jgi:8-oxo-dGTP pyrophosphatase MutT (NUDIX family)